jgi:hypothetical protein
MLAHGTLARNIRIYARWQNGDKQVDIARSEKVKQQIVSFVIKEMNEQLSAEVKRREANKEKK